MYISGRDSCITCINPSKCATQAPNEVGRKSSENRTHMTVAASSFEYVPLAVRKDLHNEERAPFLASSPADMGAVGTGPPLRMATANALIAVSRSLLVSLASKSGSTSTQAPQIRNGLPRNCISVGSGVQPRTITEMNSSIGGERGRWILSTGPAFSEISLVFFVLLLPSLLLPPARPMMLWVTNIQSDG